MKIVKSSRVPLLVTFLLLGFALLPSTDSTSSPSHPSLSAASTGATASAVNGLTVTAEVASVTDSQEHAAPASGGLCLASLLPSIARIPTTSAAGCLDTCLLSCDQGRRYCLSVAKDTDDPVKAANCEFTYQRCQGQCGNCVYVPEERDQ